MYGVHIRSLFILGIENSYENSLVALYIYYN